MRGDATTDTARLLGDLPGTEPIAVFTASLLSYLVKDARAALVAQLQQAAKRRRIAWIFAEAPGLGSGDHRPQRDRPGRPPVARRNSRYLIGASLRGPGPGGPGGRDGALLALADPYLRWLAPARHPAGERPRTGDDRRHKSAAQRN